MELKVWVGSVQRVVCGVGSTTTCQDVIIALAQATGRTGRFNLVERWRGSERPLAAADSPMLALQKWGEYAHEVKFVLRETSNAKKKDAQQQALRAFRGGVNARRGGAGGAIRKSLSFSGMTGGAALSLAAVSSKRKARSGGSAAVIAEDDGEVEGLLLLNGKAAERQLSGSGAANEAGESQQVATLGTSLAPNAFHLQAPAEASASGGEKPSQLQQSEKHRPSPEPRRLHEGAVGNLIGTVARPEHSKSREPQQPFALAAAACMPHPLQGAKSAPRIGQESKDNVDAPSDSRKRLQANVKGTTEPTATSRRSCSAKSAFDDGGSLSAAISNSVSQSAAAGKDARSASSAANDLGSPSASSADAPSLSAGGVASSVAKDLQNLNAATNASNSSLPTLAQSLLAVKDNTSQPQAKSRPAPVAGQTVMQQPSVNDIMHSDPGATLQQPNSKESSPPTAHALKRPPQKEESCLSTVDPQNISTREEKSAAAAAEFRCTTLDNAKLVPSTLHANVQGQDLMAESLGEDNSRTSVSQVPLVTMAKGESLSASKFNHKHASTASSPVSSCPEACGASLASLDQPTSVTVTRLHSKSSDIAVVAASQLAPASGLASSSSSRATEGRSSLFRALAEEAKVHQHSTSLSLLLPSHSSALRTSSNGSYDSTSTPTEGSDSAVSVSQPMASSGAGKGVVKLLANQHSALGGAGSDAADKIQQSLGDDSKSTAQKVCDVEAASASAGVPSAGCRGVVAAASPGGNPTDSRGTSEKLTGVSGAALGIFSATKLRSTSQRTLGGERALGGQKLAPTQTSVVAKPASPVGPLTKTATKQQLSYTQTTAAAQSRATGKPMQDISGSDQRVLEVPPGGYPVAANGSFVMKTDLAESQTTEQQDYGKKVDSSEQEYDSVLKIVNVQRDALALQRCQLKVLEQEVEYRRQAEEVKAEKAKAERQRLTELEAACERLDEELLVQCGGRDLANVAAASESELTTLRGDEVRTRKDLEAVRASHSECDAALDEHEQLVQLLHGHLAACREQLTELAASAERSAEAERRRLERACRDEKDALAQVEESCLLLSRAVQEAEAHVDNKQRALANLELEVARSDPGGGFKQAQPVLSVPTNSRIYC